MAGISLADIILIFIIIGFGATLVGVVSAILSGKGEAR
jgi:hypothetical protein